MNNMELRRGIEELFKLKIEENEKLKNDLNEIKRKNHKLMKSFEDEIFLNKNLKNENEILKKRISSNIQNHNRNMIDEFSRFSMEKKILEERIDVLTRIKSMEKVILKANVAEAEIDQIESISTYA